MQKITPCLWFDDNAEEAVNLYVSIFQNSRIGSVTRYDEASAKVSGRPEGSVLTVEFELEGEKFTALNGGPLFKFTEAVSFMIDCESQEEVDRLWAKLSEGGEESQCGWLKDKYGLSWQVAPRILTELLKDKDPVTSKRVMEAMLQMKKIEIKTLMEAYEGK